MDKNIESLLEKNFEDWINESLDEEEHPKGRHKKDSTPENVERVLDQQGLESIGVVNKDAEALTDFKVCIVLLFCLWLALFVMISIIYSKKLITFYLITLIDSFLKFSVS